MRKRMAATTTLDGPFIFRINDNGTGPHLLVQVCIERGWREYSGHNSLFKDCWNLWWKSGGLSQAHYKSLLPWQFINRIPKGNSICRKDNLVRHLKCMKKVYGYIYNFSPLGYILPSEYTKLAADCNRLEKDEKIWICKPVGQSQGKGIFLFRKLSDLRYDNVTVVQQYIENPLLIGGYKFDLRLYVCVPSYQPLTIYLYKHGIVRFATEKFSLESIEDSFRHLTNFSLNKLGPGYYKKKERVGAGCKWTFRQLRRYLEQSGHLDWFLWQQIACIVTLTILSQAARIPKSSNCFEFFGFDILIDDNLKPWLLEVNVSPALNNDCEVDSEVKKPLLHDLFDLLGLPVCNTGLSLFTIWTSKHLEEDVANRFYSKSSKKGYKFGREPIKIMNFGSETKSMFQHQTTDIYNETSEFNPLCMEKNLQKRLKNQHILCATRNNSRDWRKPIKKEGAWIRIYPMLQETLKFVEFGSEFVKAPKYVEKEIKNDVLCVQKFLKTAKEVHRKFGKQGDEKCNKMLQRTIKLETEIWLPNK
ncbi:PREDICTED: probable tubulin polyglutamylase TTLL2 [Ceratosolen solmsi marchali]|uniref:Probable tubulin polyglutamylase TTLL2 n=1 Tax=Ceratosolen solmsi marchali TaxID=326594 RepID=A0AAJ6YRQ9_9HYME|nr:PREDICTED: probable tubulin polyglutamylase TTLL2 [Ceratosolen solmsi marchali]